MEILETIVLIVEIFLVILSVIMLIKLDRKK